MVGIPAGNFVMGSPASEPGRFDTEGPQHVVSIKAFALGKYDITSKQFLIFLRETRYQPSPCNSTLGMGWRSGGGLMYSPEYEEPPKWAAVCLDWRDAEAYIAWLNAKVRRLRPELAQQTGPYRLPSEAEWEYAAFDFPCVRKPKNNPGRKVVGAKLAKKWLLPDNGLGGSGSPARLDGSKITSGRTVPRRVLPHAGAPNYRTSCESRPASATSRGVVTIGPRGTKLPLARRAPAHARHYALVGRRSRGT